MADYTYIFGSMRPERIIAEIPLYGTYCDNELNVGGRADGTFNLDQTGKRNQDLIDATIPGRCWEVILRDGQPIWSGFVWSRVYQSQSKSVQLFSQSWEKYPSFQRCLTNTNMTADQRVVFCNLWTQMMTETTGRDVNIIVPNVSLFSPAVVTKTVTTLATDNKFYNEIMSELADSSDGFDWTIDTILDGTNFRKSLRIGYPKLGQSTGALTFDYPGSITNYYATESMSEAGTNVLTLGTGAGSNQIAFETTNNDLIAAGFPRWDKVVSRKDIDNSVNLATFAIAEGFRRLPPALTVKPTLKGDRSPQFGEFGLGDLATVAIKDARYPSGRYVKSRIVKWTLNPSSSTNTEEYTLLFENDEEG